MARKLRVSLTDRCNLRCVYCLPAAGRDWLGAERLLSDEETVRLIAIGVGRLGLRSVRFTGGEPLLRRGLVGIVAATAALRTDQGECPDIALTSNGLGLDKRAAALAAAGLARVNISLDAADGGRYAALSRRDRFPEAVRGIDAAVAAGLAPVKVNAVVMRGANDAALPALLDFCLGRGLELRLIECMPLGPGLPPGALVTCADILAILARDHELTPAPVADPAAPARLWDVAPRPGRRGGRVGVIASMSESFCAGCDRTRLTADGQMRSCLFSGVETDLRGPLRDGADDAEIARIWAAAMAAKERDHGADSGAPTAPGRPMNSIGG